MNNSNDQHRMQCRNKNKSQQIKIPLKQIQEDSNLISDEPSQIAPMIQKSEMQRRFTQTEPKVNVFTIYPSVKKHAKDNMNIYLPMNNYQIRNCDESCQFRQTRSSKFSNDDTNSIQKRTYQEGFAKLTGTDFFKTNSVFNGTINTQYKESGSKNKINNFFNQTPKKEQFNPKLKLLSEKKNFTVETPNMNNKFLKSKSANNTIQRQKSNLRGHMKENIQQNIIRFQNGMQPTNQNQQGKDGKQQVGNMEKFHKSQFDRYITKIRNNEVYDNDFN